MPGTDVSDPPCPLCGRPIPERSGSQHHLVPKSLKGRDTVTLHRICHRKIHALFTERELQKRYDTIERLLAHPEIQKFARWVSSKPPGFYAPTFRDRRKSQR